MLDAQSILAERAVALLEATLQVAERYHWKSHEHDMLQMDAAELEKLAEKLNHSEALTSTWMPSEDYFAESDGFRELQRQHTEYATQYRAFYEDLREFIHEK